MARLLILLISLCASQQLYAACPDYLNQELRKLHSRETANLCESYAGKPMLVINTASHCGYTPQFKGLEAVYQKYKDRDLMVVGFSSDDFRQEDKDESKVADICYINYGVTFTMLAPTHVRGEEANPVFRELARQTQAPNWNFNKYLIDRDGKVVKHFGSNIKPESDALQQAIEEVL